MNIDNNLYAGEDSWDNPSYLFHRNMFWVDEAEKGRLKPKSFFPIGSAEDKRADATLWEVESFFADPYNPVSMDMARHEYGAYESDGQQLIRSEM